MWQSKITKPFRTHWKTQFNDTASTQPFTPTINITSWLKIKENIDEFLPIYLLNPHSKILAFHTIGEHVPKGLSKILTSHPTCDIINSQLKDTQFSKKLFT